MVGLGDLLPARNGEVTFCTVRRFPVGEGEVAFAEFGEQLAQDVHLLEKILRFVAEITVARLELLILEFFGYRQLLKSGDRGLRHGSREFVAASMHALGAFLAEAEFPNDL